MAVFSLRAYSGTSPPSDASDSGSSKASAKAAEQHARAQLLPALYLGLNIASAVLVVFANKLVLTRLGFSFTYCLTFIHSAMTILGMNLFAVWGLYERKRLPLRNVTPLALSYVAYIVLSNLNLKVNSVAFYSVCKISVAPIVLFLEYVLHGRRATPRVIAAVLVVCLGVAVSTVTDYGSAVSPGAAGLLIGLGAALTTSMYQIWAGSKQKELGANSSQLLQQYSPLATLLLGLLVLGLEPVGFTNPSPATILGYTYTPFAVTAILVSAVLGLFVSLSTFLAIGATSSLTYNVVGHIKTVCVLAGGKVFFGEEMPLKKLAGISVAMAGIVWYSHLKLQQAGIGGASLSAPGANRGHDLEAEQEPLLLKPDK